MPQWRGSPGRPVIAGSGTLAVPVMYSLVPQVAHVDRHLPPPVPRLEAGAQVDEPIRTLGLDGVVDRREEHAALPRHVTPHGGRPRPASRELVDSGAAARPFRRVVQSIARRVERRAARPSREVAVVGRVEPRDMARELHAAPRRRQPPRLRCL